MNEKRDFVIHKQKRTGGSDCSDTDATSHSAGIEPFLIPAGSPFVSKSFPLHVWKQYACWLAEGRVAGTRADSMKAGRAVLSWLHAAGGRAQPGLQPVRPSWPARQFNACTMRGRVRVRAITPSSPFLFGYNQISFSIHILQVKFVDKL